MTLYSGQLVNSGNPYKYGVQGFSEIGNPDGYVIAPEGTLFKQVGTKFKIKYQGGEYIDTEIYISDFRITKYSGNTYLKISGDNEFGWEFIGKSTSPESCCNVNTTIEYTQAPIASTESSPVFNFRFTRPQENLVDPGPTPTPATTVIYQTPTKDFSQNITASFGPDPTPTVTVTIPPETTTTTTSAPTVTVTDPTVSAIKFDYIQAKANGLSCGYDNGLSVFFSPKADVNVLITVNSDTNITSAENPIFIEGGLIASTIVNPTGSTYQVSVLANYVYEVTAYVPRFEGQNVNISIIPTPQNGNFFQYVKTLSRLTTTCSLFVDGLDSGSKYRYNKRNASTNLDNKSVVYSCDSSLTITQVVNSKFKENDIVCFEVVDSLTNFSSPNLFPIYCIPDTPIPTDPTPGASTVPPTIPPTVPPTIPPTVPPTTPTTSFDPSGSI